MLIILHTAFTACDVVEYVIKGRLTIEIYMCFGSEREREKKIQAETFFPRWSV